MRWTALCAIALTALLAATPCLQVQAQEGRSIRVHLGEKEARVPAISHEGQEYVSIKSVASALAVAYQRQTDGSVRLAHEGSEVLFPMALPSMARSSRGYLSLGLDVIRRGEDLFLPVAALPRVLEALTPSGIPSGRPSSSLRISLLGGGPGKLRLSVDLPVSPVDLRYEKSSQGHWRVFFTTPTRIQLPWQERELGHDLVQRLRLRDGGGGGTILEVFPGPGLEALTVQRRESSPGFDLRLISRPVGAALPDATTDQTVRRVVIDPGHGGSEDGAIGPTGVTEKELVLDVSRLLAARLRADGFEVVLTRDSDEDLSLDDRAAIANHQRADLFISIHANASRFRGARGAETYFLAREATDDEARTTAALENNAAGAAPGPGGGKDLSLILWDLAQVEHLEDSARLAETIQAELNAVLGIPDRGVRQAPFRVLVGATCASVLVELGFLTHREEERLLATTAYRRKLATALADAIREFRDSGNNHWTPTLEIGR